MPDAIINPCEPRRVAELPVPVQDLDGAFRAVDSDPVAAVQVHRRVAAADDGGDAELAGHDRGMGQRRADVGNYRGRPREDRCPADVGHGGYQDLAVAELAGVLDSADHPRHAFGYAGCPGKSGDGVVRWCDRAAFVPTAAT